ncbi:MULTISPECIES: amino acid ABC transporter permease [unclassified Rhizobium]|uniref:amino acid ABC transporter permease n=1 Tax=unclassified Rhizobium TaxID=2613769 RepID=UPI000EA87EF9|nr:MULTISPECIES: amino acid ABC transporter permease [unclassified Rhizobium]AYG67484.1 amino acid ABC transporter permease [Rhizobium sp. CCGE531]AYG73878.1 amino acid ABC transporter permease [Rhizobium sp. CCGE532]
MNVLPLKDDSVSAARTRFTVVPLRHPWRWAAATIVAILLLLLLQAVVSNPNLQWPVVASYILNPIIVQGLWVTVGLTLAIMFFASVIGMIVALMMLSPSKMLSVPAAAFIWWFRGTPALVQLILWYNLSLIFKDISLWLPGLGTVFSIPTNTIMTPLVAAVVALSLHEAGYMAEIIRNGLKSVNRGQTEAALCLGMKPSLLLRRIVIPQAMRVIIPPTGNETINLLKTTSLVSIIAVGDLLYSAQAIYARTFETIPLLLVATFWYLVVVSIMTIGQGYLERHYSRDEAGPKPAPGGFSRLGSILMMREKWRGAQ